MKLLAGILVLLFCFNLSVGQIKNTSTRGRVFDLLTNRPLPGASVSFFKDTDSSKIKTTFTNEHGLFNVDSIGGPFFLIISYIGYRNYLLTTQKIDTSIVNIGMEKSDFQLKEVEIVKSVNPISKKGDTLQFEASYYRKSDDLVLGSILKKIPGFTVSTDGNIYFNGQVVKKILIDGKTYFGNDVKTALLNISSNIIKKIQITDEYSEETLLNGGIKTKDKVINLTIKDESRNNVNGQLLVSGGNKNQMALKGSMSKIGNNNLLSIIGTVTTNNNILENTTPQKIISKIFEGGISFSTNNNGKLLFAASYKTNKIFNREQHALDRRYFLVDSSYMFHEETSLNDSRIGHVLSARVDFIPDSLTKFFIENLLVFDDLRLTNASGFLTSGESLNKINSGEIDNESMKKKMDLGGSINYLKKFRKRNNSITLTVAYNYYGSSGNSINKASNFSVNENQIPYNKTSNQRDIDSGHGYKIRLTSSYTESIGKNSSLSLYMGYIWENAPLFKITDDFDSTTNSYHLLNDSLSCRQFNRSASSYFDLIFKKSKGDFDLSLSLKGINVNLNSKNDKSLLGADLKFGALIPSAMVSYKFNKSSSLLIYYNNQNQIPTFYQLNPVPINTNPSIIYKGNEFLKPGYTHNLSLLFTRLNTANWNSLTLQLLGSVSHNQIIDMVWIDKNGNQNFQAMNVSGIKKLSVSANSYWQIGKDISLAVSSDGRFDNSIFLYNNEKSNSENWSVIQTAKINYNSKLFQALFNGSIGYNRTSFPREARSSIDLLSYSITFDGSLKLPIGFSIGSYLFFSDLKQLGSGSNSILMSNVYLAKSFLDEKIISKIQVLDVFNQNKSISRTLAYNYIEERKDLMLGRTFFLSASFLFGK
ncbi:hypothetical protein J2T02_001970 [Chitinophaga terrae (ex Kim and Jung 2007)]|uniref:outer membrane beta-barrel protein n=1 Tax=Chitinophaga terrae (ex Kim and Jung 2007) TaxID=408074 RepID=UPI002782CA93|nr:outer membrane beta-barrel protein [Chitinophaga terrae (ex Kim and Jung 2007)]MDQ0106857.1 hypothetical protein [Chitinophaga terrae (ex Kim and Jung 2007)]